MASARAGIEICGKKLEDLRHVALAKQRKHLTERLKHHRKQENEKVQRKIEKMMNREETIEYGADSDVPQELLDHKLHHKWTFKTNMDNE